MGCCSMRQQWLHVNGRWRGALAEEVFSPHNVRLRYLWRVDLACAMVNSGHPDGRGMASPSLREVSPQERRCMVSRTGRLTSAIGELMSGSVGETCKRTSKNGLGGLTLAEATRGMVYRSRCGKGRAYVRMSSVKRNLPP